MPEVSGRSVSRKVFLFTIVLFGFLQTIEISYLVLHSHSTMPANANQPAQEIRTQALALVTPENNEVMSLKSYQVEYTEGGAPPKRGYQITAEMRQPGETRPAIRLESTPLGGPHISLSHHRSNSFLSISCIQSKSFSIVTGTEDPPSIGLRLCFDTEDHRLVVCNSLDQPFLLINGDSDKHLSPWITIISDLDQPLRIEKQPQPNLKPFH